MRDPTSIYKVESHQRRQSLSISDHTHAHVCAPTFIHTHVLHIHKERGKEGRKEGMRGRKEGKKEGQVGGQLPNLQGRMPLDPHKVMNVFNLSTERRWPEAPQGAKPAWGGQERRTVRPRGQPKEEDSEEVDRDFFW